MRKHLHFVGIAEAELSTLARIMLAGGWLVSDSDRIRNGQLSLPQKGLRFLLSIKANRLSVSRVR